MLSQLTAASSGYLERLAAELDVPPSRYEEAESRYKSLGEWLSREGSALQAYSPEVYVQGSFRLGTPIRPVNDDEHYDIDLVCELQASKSDITQQQLKALLGKEMELYAERYGMKKPSEGRRCWTLDYADGAQFHLDALPAIPDSAGKRLLLEARAMNANWVESAIAITDVDHPNFGVRSTGWPHSNPKGYMNWFRSRMKVAFDMQRAAMALEAKASVEDIPSYRVKTPLQQAVQILKRHRDMMFVENSDDKPISVIITTLAGLSYDNESHVGYALESILARMDSHIEIRGGVAWIPNPTDPEENFADRWATNPKRRDAFFAWLAAARKDFATIAAQTTHQRLVETASPVVGDRLAKAASQGHTGHQPVGRTTFSQRIASVFNAAHKEAAPWQVVRQGSVKIDDATISRDGFRVKRFTSDGAPLPKNSSLQFRAKTDVPPPFEVYWQVVNTGVEAAAKGQLRGGFALGAVERGTIVHKEGTSYTGTHTIECFIVKGGYLVARSGAFIVNIS